MKKMGDYFNLTSRKTNWKTEVLAGLTTFLTMAYVLITQPAAIVGFGPVMSITDTMGIVISKEGILLLTALVSGLVTLFMGLFANLPFALSTGMGMNFILGGMIQSNVISFGGAMAIVLISGILFLLVSVLGIRELVVVMIPKNIKLGMCVIVGLLLGYLGMKDSGIIVASPMGGFSFGDMANPLQLISIGALLLIAILHSYKVKGSVLIGMVVATLIGIPFGITNVPEQLTSLPHFKETIPLVFNFDFKSVLNITMIPLIFIAFSTDFFASLAAFIGLGAKADMLDENGNMADIHKPFIVDSVGTVFGGFFGCTTITTFAESATGIEDGGRTGLTSVVTALCFILALFLAPLLLMIPSAATGPALIFVGFGLITQVKNLELDDFSESFPAIIMILITAFTASLPTAISAGVLIHVLLKIVTGKAREIHAGLYGLSVFMILYFIFGM
jgi:AGZA family xanthine/uracil permease-like MFS transporter